MPKARPAPGPVEMTPTDPIQPLIDDLLTWLAPGPRPYDEVMDRWRTNCPRLTVWEDAVDGRWVARTRSGPGPALVRLTPLGRRRLRGRGPGR